MRSRSGFTFLEILITVLIISILSGVVGLSLYRHVRKTRIEATRVQIKILRTALIEYRADNDYIPSQDQGLEALCVKPTTGRIPPNYPDEGYLESRILPNDGWQNPFVYLVPGRNGEPYEIISYGADAEPGGTGDDTDISRSSL